MEFEEALEKSVRNAYKPIFFSDLKDKVTYEAGLDSLGYWYCYAAQYRRTHRYCAKHFI